MAVPIIELLLVTSCPIASTTLANWFHVLVNLADFTVTTKSVSWLAMVVLSFKQPQVSTEIRNWDVVAQAL